MKLTKHNGRAGKNGVYNPKHNDRNFDVSNSEHIDEQRAEHNIYWDCYNGYRQLAEKNSDEIELASTFEEVEHKYRESSSATQYTQHIRSTGILTTMLTNIDTVVASANPDCTRY